MPRVTSVLETIPKGSKKRLEELEITERMENNRGEAFLSWRPEEICCYSDFSKRLAGNAGVTILKEYDDHKKNENDQIKRLGALTLFV